LIKATLPSTNLRSQEVPLLSREDNEVHGDSDEEGDDSEEAERESDMEYEIEYDENISVSGGLNLMLYGS
jgi:hypothetical protein